MWFRAFLASAAAAASVAVLAPTVAADDAVSPRVWEAYAAAIADAAVSRPGEVVTDLVVASPDDPRTEWMTIDGESYMLVARLGYRPISAVAAGEPFLASSPIFVFSPAELLQACEEYDCAGMSDRGLDRQLKRIVGLAPDADYSVVSRMWVRPTDLFRPCTQVDPMIPTCPQLVANTVHAGVDRSPFLFEQAMYSWRVQRRGTTAPISCAQDFRNSMAGNCFGYPWTRLGYTYDWTPGARDDRGLTEFVIAPGSRVVLESTGPQRQYLLAAGRS